jgi:hypothetical protein
MTLLWQRRPEDRCLHIAFFGKSREGMGIAKPLKSSDFLNNSLNRRSSSVSLNLLCQLIEGKQYAKGSQIIF